MQEREEKGHLGVWPAHFVLALLLWLCDLGLAIELT